MHQLGFSHLDIKPDNILLESSNYNKCESSIISLVDFGLAKPFLNSSEKHLGV